MIQNDALFLRVERKFGKFPTSIIENVSCLNNDAVQVASKMRVYILLYLIGKYIQC